MATQYFFAHGETQHGPYSADELLGLATAGQIEPTDIVWRLGIGCAIPAARVKHLFPSTLVAPPAAVVAVVAPVEKPATPDTSAFVPATEKPTAMHTERPRRVCSIKGGILVTQDGRQVQFRKKCPTCNTEEQCRTTAIIRPGAMKFPYFCRKCRKGRTVEMMGSS